MSLAGPDGDVPVATVPAAEGRLAFVTPNVPLAPDTPYPLSIRNATDERGVSVAPVDVALPRRRMTRR
jgi:hypothetical protein